MRTFLDMNKGGGGAVLIFLQTNTIVVGDIVYKPYILEAYPFRFLEGRRRKVKRNKQINNT